MTKLHAQKGGRTWPRLIDDLLRFLPGIGYMNLSPIEASRSSSAKSFNSLCYLDPCPVPYKVESFDHKSQVYYLILANIMYHVEIHIESRSIGEPVYYDFHLIQPQNQQQSDAYKGYEEYSYICYQTSSELKVIIRPPEFNSNDLAAFSQEEISKRYQQFKEFKPSATCPTPAMCFQTLHKIIQQPFMSEVPREIAVNNPSMNMKINRDLLSKLHFTLDEERNCYVPPNLFDYSSIETSNVRKHMVRMLVEAAVLTQKAESKGQHSNFSNMYHLENAQQVLLNALPTPLLLQNPYQAHDYYGFYVTLGATPAFDDVALFHRYEIQVQNDPTRAHYYLDAIKNLTQFLGSEYLEVKVLELMSLGVATVADVADAYSKFNIPMESLVNDNEIIEAYNKMVQRNPQAKDGLIQAMKVIANVCKSDVIRSFANNVKMDLEQAYKFLEIPENAIDDTIIATFDLKNCEATTQASSEDLPKQALLLIAKYRKSPILLSKYEEFTFGITPDMSLDEAYALLGVDSTMDEQSILAIFDIRLIDNSESILEMRQALRTIASDRNSKLLLQYLQTGNSEPVDDGSLLWPVGLNNIGNTCYLNSLFQSYFTLTPLRNAVLEFESSSNKEEVSPTLKKKVGGREITQWEVKRSQEFVKCLAELFNELIYTKKRYISPTRDLAYLALVPAQEDLEIVESTDKADDEDVKMVDYLTRPRIQVDEVSEHDHDRTDDSDHDGEPMLINVRDENDDEKAYIDAEPAQNIKDKIGETDGLDSETDDQSIDRENTTIESQPLLMIDDMQNVKTLEKKDFHDSDDLTKIQINDETQTTDVMSDDLHSENSVVDDKSTSPNDTLKKEADNFNYSVKPVQPPSDISKERSRRIDSALLGRQQDVTECIENVLFQIEAAFKPSGFDEDGEQLDIIKDLFYGKTKQLLESDLDGSNRREKEERFSSILVDVADGPRDIYDALDAYFGEDVLELESGTTRRSVTISHLPPVLQIQIQRVQYDRVLNQPFKSLALLKFDEIIYMDRYLEGDSTLRDRRRSVYNWRKELSEVKKKLKEINSRGSLNATNNWFKSLANDNSELKVDSATIDLLDSKIKTLSDELSNVNSLQAELKKKIQTQFEDLQNVGYRCHSIFVHRGQASFGHYWIYINDFKNKIFRKYNDEYVTEVPYKEVFDDNEENTATPYFLVFIREDMSESYSEAVVRDVSVNDFE